MRETRRGGYYGSYATRTRSLVFSPDGRWLIAGGSSVRVWEAKSGRLRLALPFAADSVDMSPDRKLIVGADSTVNALGVWSFPSGRLLQRIGFDNEVGVAAFAPDATIITGSAGLRLDWKKRRILQKPRGFYHGGFEEQAAFSGDHLWVAVSEQKYAGYGDVGYEVRRRVVLRSTRTDALRWATPLPEIGLKPVLALSPDGAYVAMSEPNLAKNNSVSVRVWSVQTQRVVAQNNSDTWRGPGQVAALAFSPDGNTLAIGGIGWGKPVKLWRWR